MKYLEWLIRIVIFIGLLTTVLSIDAIEDEINK